MPCRLSAMQQRAPSWAGMSTGGFSVLARSTICTWPECVPGKASKELLLFGHSTHRPEGGAEGDRSVRHDDDAATDVVLYRTLVLSIVKELKWSYSITLYYKTFRKAF